jgi:acyl-CoA synthetase (AMP-forming)/AMP-acid ligase II
VLVQELLDLPRIDVLSAADHHVLDPADDPHVALIVHRRQIARYKIPRYVKLVDSFPMTVTGKVQKFKMREVAIEELGLGQAAAIATA